MDENSNTGRLYSTHTIRSILGLKDETTTSDSLRNDDKSTSINIPIKTVLVRYITAICGMRYTMRYGMRFSKKYRKNRRFLE